jgi:O-antigen/teichoic acid export membrane protein
MSTYIVGVLVLLVSGVCVVAPDLVAISTTAAFHGAAIVTPWIALGVMCQGFYLVGSIGLVITKRTTVYPIATGIAAGTSVIGNLVLIPRFGMIGAAWANAIAYATLAGVTSAFSWRAYPIPYEWSRLSRIAIAGLAAYVAATRLVPDGGRPIERLLVGGAATVPVYALVLYATRFFHAGELRLLRDIRRRALERRPIPTVDPGAQEVEMAGELLGAPPDVDAEPIDTRSVSPDSPARRR